MDDAAVTRLLGGLTGKGPEAGDRADAQVRPGPVCVPLSRVRTALLRENWTGDEQRHLASCSHCRRSEQLCRTQVSHPSLLHLFWHVRGLLDSPDGDVAYHLQKDACKRCLRLASLIAVDQILSRLGTQARTNAKAANRLGRVLAGATVATVTPGAVPPGGRVCCEDSKRAVLLTADDPGRIRIEFPATERTSLVHLLVGNQHSGREQLVVPHPVTGARVAEVRLSDPSPERVVVAMYEVEPALLGREDAARLQNGFAAALKVGPKAAAAWRSWAAQAMHHPELDAALRPALDAISRPDGGKRA